MADNEVKEVTDKKIEAWLKQLVRSNMSVNVGLVGNPETEGADSDWAAKKGRNAEGQIESTTTSLFMVAAVHEFGSVKRNIPERSYLRSTFDEHKEGMAKIFTAALRMQGATYGSTKPEQEKVFSIVGQWMVDKVKSKFTSNTWAALKDPTRGGRNKEGRAKPLIDTGQLRSSISYEVVEGGAE